MNTQNGWKRLNETRREMLVFFYFALTCAFSSSTFYSLIEGNVLIWTKMPLKMVTCGAHDRFPLTLMAKMNGRSTVKCRR